MPEESDTPGRPDPSSEHGADELYEHAPCALLSTLPNGLIIRANQTFLDWIGHSRDAVIGQMRFQTLLTMGARMYYETHYSPLLQMQGVVNEIALEVKRADGSVCPVVASARQVRDAAGLATAHRVALFDSTDRRRYERELLVARQRAEQDADALADADRRKNEFIATLAHELRNPLAPLRSAVAILRRSEHGNQTVARTTAMMERQVEQLGRLVEDLLDVGRVGQDKLSLHRTPVDLASLLRHAAETSEPLLHGAGLTFSMSLPSTAIYVAADAARVSQAIGNILNNAAKFTPRDGAVSLTLQREGDEAIIRVRDTGIGIDKAKLSRVFDMFMQGDVSRERRDGLGIGLTLAKSLIERHDGRIAAHSDGLGHGTEFVIRLPVLTEVIEHPSEAVAAPDADVKTSPRRVLVVDDNHDAAELMAMLLGFSGHVVRMAHDGLDAVEAAATFHPDVILLDIGLPRLDGYEVAQRIREQSSSPPVLVALTGWGQDEDRRRSFAAGFDLHLVKPVDHDVLTKLIAALPSRPA